MSLLTHFLLEYLINHYEAIQAFSRCAVYVHITLVLYRVSQKNVDLFENAITHSFMEKSFPNFL